MTRGCAELRRVWEEIPEVLLRAEGHVPRR